MTDSLLAYWHALLPLIGWTLLTYWGRAAGQLRHDLLTTIVAAILGPFVWRAGLAMESDHLINAPREFAILTVSVLIAINTRYNPNTRRDPL